MRGRHFIFFGAVLGGLAVALGAFGAHGLEGYLVAHDQGANYETAVRYQMYHALAMLAVGLIAKRGNNTALKVTGWCFLGGTTLFCGALYGIALAHIRLLGMVAPVGGVLFIVGWLALAVAALQRTPDEL